MSGKVKGKRRGRPPGSKNRIKEGIPIPAPVVRPNGIRKRAPRTPRATFLQVSPKYQKLIQKWSNETKIGMQQVLDDILLAGANAAHKSFYRGLINSRKATEALFDAETNTEGVAKTEPVERNGSLDTESDQPLGRTIRDSLSPEPVMPAPVRPRHSKETSANPGEPTRELVEEYLTGVMQDQAAVIDTPPTQAPEEEQIEEDDQNDEPPY